MKKLVKNVKKSVNKKVAKKVVTKGLNGAYKVAQVGYVVCLPFYIKSVISK